MMGQHGNVLPFLLFMLQSWQLFSRFNTHQAEYDKSLRASTKNLAQVCYEYRKVIDSVLQQHVCIHTLLKQQLQKPLDCVFLARFAREHLKALAYDQSLEVTIDYIFRDMYNIRGPKKQQANRCLGKPLLQLLQDDNASNKLLLLSMLRHIFGERAVQRQLSVSGIPDSSEHELMHLYSQSLEHDAVITVFLPACDQAAVNINKITARLGQSMEHCMNTDLYQFMREQINATLALDCKLYFENASPAKRK